MSFWRERSIHTRRRIVALAGLLALIAVFVFLVVPNLPCGFPGGEACAPDDDAAALVPADALAYVHANLDPDTEQYDRAAAFARELPTVGGQVAGSALTRIPGDALTPTAFDERVRPWFGGELALATLPADPPEQLVLLEVGDAEGAAEYAESIATGAPETTEYREVELSEDRRGVATAQVEGFLVLGTASGVREAIDVGTGAEGAEPLADDGEASELRDSLPEHRVADAWLSGAGATELSGDRRGPLASVAAFIAPGTTGGVAAAVGANEDGELELAVRSALDPERAESTPAFFSAFDRFSPGLPERLPEDTLGYVGVDDPGETAARLLEQAAAQAPGVAEGFERLVDRLGRDAGVDLEQELLDSLGGEGALALAPGAEETTPYAEFIADDVDEEAAREALAALQTPIAEAADPGKDLQAPVFSEQQFGDVEARSIRISPTIELTYAVFEGLAAVASAPEGIEALTESPEGGGLAAAELYREATDELGDSDEVSALAFLDLAGLIELAEALGLGEDPVYAGLAGEFRRLDALGVAVAAEEDLLATDARLLLGD